MIQYCVHTPDGDHQYVTGLALPRKGDAIVFHRHDDDPGTTYEVKQVGHDVRVGEDVNGVPWADYPQVVCKRPKAS